MSFFYSCLLNKIFLHEKNHHKKAQNYLSRFTFLGIQENIRSLNVPLQLSFELF